LPQAPVRQPVHLERAGVVAAIDVRALGLAVVGLGGGRKRAAEAVDPRVGLAEVRGIGEEVGPDAAFAVVHAAATGDAAAAAEVLRKAVQVVEAVPAATPPTIIERVAPAAIGP
jgi:thymidine phosphorylase